MSNHSIFALTYQMSRNKQKAVYLTKKHNLYISNEQKQTKSCIFNKKHNLYISNEQKKNKKALSFVHNRLYFMINTKISFNSSNKK